MKEKGDWLWFGIPVFFSIALFYEWFNKVPNDTWYEAVIVDVVLYGLLGFLIIRKRKYPMEPMN